MNLTATQIEALRTLADGNVRQIRVSAVRRTQTSVCGWRRSTIDALVSAGAIVTKGYEDRETERGVTTYFVMTDAQITNTGRALLAMLAAA